MYKLWEMFSHYIKILEEMKEIKFVALLLSILFIVVNGQVDKENFRLYMGRILTDEGWKKMFKELQQQHKYCPVGANDRFENAFVQIKSYVGRFGRQYDALMDALLNSKLDCISKFNTIWKKCSKKWSENSKEMVQRDGPN